MKKLTKSIELALEPHDSSVIAAGDEHDGAGNEAESVAVNIIVLALRRCFILKRNNYVAIHHFLCYYTGTN